MYTLRYVYFLYGGRHLGFSTSDKKNVIRVSFNELPVCIAVGVVLLSYVLYFISCIHRVIGHHLRSISLTPMSESTSHSSNRVIWFQHHQGDSHWNRVTIMCSCIQTEIEVVIQSTSGLWPLFLIYHLRWCPAVFILVTTRLWSSNMWVGAVAWILLLYHVYKVGYGFLCMYFRWLDAILNGSNTRPPSSSISAATLQS